MAKKPTLLIIAILLIQEMVTAQKIEYSANVNSGFFHYAGEDPSPFLPTITLFPEPLSFPVGTPGKKSGFSIEVSVQAQKVSAKKIIYGLDLSYQSLQSKADIVAITPTIYSSSLWPASGTMKLTGEYIGIHPFAGYRFSSKKITIDLKAGPEYAHCVDRNQKMNATVYGLNQKFFNKYNVSNKPSDFRIRGQVTIMYKRFGINAGYSHGLTNFYKEDAAANPEYYSSFVRLGVNYRIR